MEIESALEILESLADGVDPFTSEVFRDGSPYQHPQVARAGLQSLPVGSDAEPTGKSSFVGCARAILI